MESWTGSNIRGLFAVEVAVLSYGLGRLEGGVISIFSRVSVKIGFR